MQRSLGLSKSIDLRSSTTEDNKPSSATANPAFVLDLDGTVDMKISITVEAWVIWYGTWLGLDETMSATSSPFPPEQIAMSPLVQCFQGLAVSTEAEYW